MFKRKLFVISALVTAIMLTGCNKSQDAVIEKSQSYEFEIGTFDDFTYLMFTIGDGHVIRDKDGNEYHLGDDGYYHDDNGNRIKEYGAGDADTAENADALGAKLKSQIKKNDPVNIKENSDNSPEMSNKGHSGASADDLKEVVGNVDMVIDDWSDYKKKIMEEAGIQPTTEKPWYDDYVKNDELDNLILNDSDDKPEEKLQNNTTYNTVVDVGGGVPGQLHIDKLSVGSNASISGSISVDADAFEKYMNTTYGDTQFDEDGNEVPADYKSYLNTVAMDIKFVVTDPGWMDARYISAGDLHFDENYNLSFNLDAEVPDGYTVYFYMQGLPYAIQ